MNDPNAINAVEEKKADDSPLKKQEKSYVIPGRLNKEGLKCYDADRAPYRFETFDNSARNYLKENGFVAIGNVLSKEEIKEAKLLLWDFIESNCGMKEGHVRTWDNENFMTICGESMSAMIWDMGASQSEFQWYIRTHPKVLDAFVKAWNVESSKDLLCSMDGFCLFRPWDYSQANGKKLGLNTDGSVINNENSIENGKKDLEGVDYCKQYWKTKNGWYHVDQNPISKPDFECLQGYVTLLDQNEYTGGTTIIDKTHLDFKKVIPKHTDRYAGDWVMIPQSCDKILSDERDRLLICVKAGDLVIWDSRLVHCSTPAVRLRDINNNNSDEKQTGKEKEKGKEDTENKDEKESNKNEKNKNDESKDETKKDENSIMNDKKDKVLGNKENNVDFIRIVSMVTYSPKKKVKSANIYSKRVDAYMKHVATSHWPHEFKVLARPALGIAKWKNMKLKNLAELKQEKHQVRASLLGYPEYLALNPQ